MIIKTPSRLHLGLIDLNGEIGRIDGGIGLALEEPSIKLKVKKSSRLMVKGPQSDRVKIAAQTVIEHLKIKKSVSINIIKSFEPHIGLGSGTQLMLGVGKAVSHLYSMDISTIELARIMRRGGTSGIGTAVFENGGFVLDGGHSIIEKREFLPSSKSRAKAPPILLRYDFPNWPICIITPKGEKIKGKNELGIFQKICPLPIEEVRALCHIIIMKMLPSIVEQDMASFGASVNEIQSIGFKKRELDLQSIHVKETLKICKQHSFGAGLSSFGPSIYCITDDPDKLIDKVAPEYKVKITRANNKGALIRE